MNETIQNGTLLCVDSLATLIAKLDLPSSISAPTKLQKENKKKAAKKKAKKQARKEAQGGNPIIIFSHVLHDIFQLYLTTEDTVRTQRVNKSFQ